MLNRLRGFLGADLAIDLGTANTLISVAGEGLVLNEPSVVAVKEGTREILAGGRALAAWPSKCSAALLARSASSALADGVITDFELCEAMLRYFIARAGAGAGRAGRACWSPCRPRSRRSKSAPSTIAPARRRPAGAFGQRGQGGRHRRRTACGRTGGQHDLRHRRRNHRGRRTQYDRCRSRRIDPRRRRRLDRAIADYLRRHYSLRIGLATAERLRIEIGSAYPLAEELVEEVRGADAISGLPRKATITSEEIRELGARSTRLSTRSNRCSTAAAPIFPPIWSTMGSCWREAAP